MMKKKMIPVIFRKWKEDNEVFAIFPTDIATMDGSVTVYSHIGQHGSGSMRTITGNKTKLASLSEYRNLLRELNSIGYKNLVVYKKDTNLFQNERRNKINKLRNQ